MSDIASAFDEIPAGAGPIGLLSSDEFYDGAEPFDREMIDLAGPRIALVLAADPRAAPHSARLGLAWYRRLGADPFVLDVLYREQAAAEALPPFDILFMAGGSPRALVRALRDTPFWDEAVARWRAGAALAGSSAGAMALSAHCLLPGPGDRVPTRWDRGLGPLEQCGFAVHATSRPRDWMDAVAAAAPVPVVALDDSTGIVLRHGEAPAIRGPGTAWVL